MVSTWLVSAEEGVQLVTWTLEDQVQYYTLYSVYFTGGRRAGGRCGQVGAAWIKAHFWDYTLYSKCAKKNIDISASHHPQKLIKP